MWGAIKDLQPTAPVLKAEHPVSCSHVMLCCMFLFVSCVCVGDGRGEFLYMYVACCMSCVYCWGEVSGLLSIPWLVCYTHFLCTLTICSLKLLPL